MPNGDVTTNDIMDFLKESTMTRDEVSETFASKSELQATEARILSAVD